MFDDIPSVLQPLPFKVKIFEIGNRIGRPFSITKMEQVARRAYIYIYIHLHVVALTAFSKHLAEESTLVDG